MSVSIASSSASAGAPSKPQIEGYRDQWRSRVVRQGWVDPKELLMNPANWRIHPDNQKSVMTKTLSKTGWTDDVKIQDGSNLVLDGHMRCGLAIDAGELVPAKWLDLDDEEAAEMLALFDPIGAMAERDGTKYRELMERTVSLDEEIREQMLAMQSGQAAERERAARKARRGDPESTPDAPDVPVVALGDIWRLGDHVLMIGDCNDTVMLASALDELGVQKVDLLYTDPPYNADYVSRVDKKRPHPFGKIQGDNQSEADYLNFLIDTFITASAVMAAGASAYVWIDEDHYSLLERCFKERWTKHDTIVWNKGRIGMGSMYRKQHEFLIFGSQSERPAIWAGGHDQANVWSISRDPSSTYKHPMQKPVELARRAIQNSCPSGGAVADFFAGSGHTLIASEEEGARCLAAEIEPRWAEVAIRRWQDFADDIAYRVTDGVGFDELLARVR